MVNKDKKHSGASFEQYASVARNCPGYSPIGMNLTSSADGASCSNCEHFKDHVCDADLYDKVAASLAERPQ